MIDQVSHRPWPVAAGSWIMSQRWRDLLFAHWPVPAAALRPRVPERLEIDTFNGTAWIGVVPFRMEAVRPRGLPAVPWLSAFPELNVRTYVRLADRPGVLFFSLDAGNPVAVGLARRLFYLPYFRARMSCEAGGEEVAYRSTRTHAGVTSGRFYGSYRPAGEIFHAAPGSLEHFLTERYCLYASPMSVGKDSGDLYRGEIHHGPWPLQRAEAEIAANSLMDLVDLDPGRLEAAAGPPHLLFARRIDVRVWPLRKV